MNTDEEWTIAPAGTGELAVTREMLGEFYREEGLPTTSAQMTPPLTRLLQQDRGVVLLARMAAQALGFAVVATSLGVEQGGLIAELTDLWVRPEVRQRGIGSSLLLASAEWARRGGCVVIQLVVTPEAEAAHGLIAYYRSKDFLPTGRTMMARRLSEG